MGLSGMRDLRVSVNLVYITTVDNSRSKSYSSVAKRLLLMACFVILKLHLNSNRPDPYCQGKIGDFLREFCQFRQGKYIFDKSVRSQEILSSDFCFGNAFF